ncbi:hypothetical protein AAFC00_001456 [Neodothiora populina]|uniref:Uncharacterized protein n=1 Tax=Neodothiora populina TaxID=2781224 RepID=A0ABR3PNX5_9PEZI
MSAPNQGRQSPDPEHQTDAQQGSNSAPNDQGAGPKSGNAQTHSDDQKKGLASNPGGPLDKAAEEKTSKK